MMKWKRSVARAALALAAAMMAPGAVLAGTACFPDNTSPTAFCVGGVTAYLDSNGQTSITESDVDAGSYDDCGAVSLSLDRSTFGCSDRGGVWVTLTVTDGGFNTDTCETFVDVVDNLPPSLSIGNGQITKSELDSYFGSPIPIELYVDTGTFDNCEGSSLFWSYTPSSLSCGDNSIEVTVSDGTNSTSGFVTLTVVDDVNPTAVCTSATIYLDSTGTAYLSSSDIDGGSSDDCSGVSLSIDRDTFTCSDIGDQFVNLTATDDALNQDVCTATVTVVDDLGPDLFVFDPTLYLDASGLVTVTAGDVDNGTTDNCTPAGELQWTFTPASFTCAEMGPQWVDVTVRDLNGNESSTSVLADVVDNTNPTASCKFATVYLDENGQASITADDIDNGSADNCGINERIPSRTTFDCGDVQYFTRAVLGVPVNLTVKDAAGNEDTCSTYVTVLDNRPPTPSCKSIEVALDEFGSATITGADVNNGSSDNCTPAASLQLSVSPDTFTCANVGPNTVTLTVRDRAGNADTCQATVTVTASAACAPPDDGDGVPAATENAGPNGGDANNDGTLDSLQPNVTSFPNGAIAGANAGQYITLVSPPGTQIGGIDLGPAPAPYPAGVTDFPVGAFIFSLTGVAPFPALTDVQVIMEVAPVPATNAYFKFNTQYFPFTAPVLPLPGGATGATFDGVRTWTLHLTDNTAGLPPFQLSGDLNDTPGLIVDPGGPAVTGPLLVSLSSFSATSTPDGVKLDWTTTAEINNAGFNVYRIDADGLTLLNATVIPAEGIDGAGATYSYFDDSTTAGSYYLEDIDLNGTRTLHGPATAQALTDVRDWSMY